MPFWPQSLATRHAELEEPDDRLAIRRLVEQTAALGLEVEHLRVRSPRPVQALIELAGEREAGLLVLGPDPSRLRPRSFRRAVRRIPQAGVVPAVGGRRRPLALGLDAGASSFAGEELLRCRAVLPSITVTTIRT